MPDEGTRPSFLANGLIIVHDAGRPVTRHTKEKIIPRQVRANKDIQGEVQEGPAHIHDVVDVRLLETTGSDGARETPGAQVLTGQEPSAAASEPARGASALVLAGEGRPMGLEGVAAVPGRAARAEDEGRRVAPVIPQVAGEVVEARRRKVRAAAAPGGRQIIGAQATWLIRVTLGQKAAVGALLRRPPKEEDAVGRATGGPTATPDGVARGGPVVLEGPMIRALAPTLLGVILGERPVAARPIVETRPIRVTAIHGEERHTAARADTVPEATVKAVARDTPLPPSGCVGVLLLIAGGEEGLAPARRQAQANGHVVQAPVAFGALGPLLEHLVVQVGHEPLGRPVEAEA